MMGPGASSCVVVVGEHRRGKSSFINGLLGVNGCDVWDMEVTRVPYVITHGSMDASTRVVLTTGERTWLTDEDSRRAAATRVDHCSSVVIERTVPAPMLAGGTVIVDTPGLDGLDSAEARSTLALVGQADQLVIVTDASRPFSPTELGLVEEAIRVGATTTCVVTKTDLFPNWGEVVETNQATIDHLTSMLIERVDISITPVAVRTDDDTGVVTITPSGGAAPELDLANAASRPASRPAPRPNPAADEATVPRPQPAWSGLSRLVDITGLVWANLRSRPLRSFLTALGVAIGVATAVTVLGVSASSKAEVLAELDRVGTNLLRVEAGVSHLEDRDGMAPTAAARVGRISAVRSATTLVSVDRRVTANDLVNEGRTHGISVRAVDSNLLETLGGAMALGSFPTEAHLDLPVAVLGSVAAERFTIDRLDPRPVVVVGGERLMVTGVLEPLTFHPDLDRTVLVGAPFAERVLDTVSAPDAMYLRVDPDQVNQVADLLARTIEPADPGSVGVTRPSEALAARAAVDRSLTRLLVGLGSVALAVGGFGIANMAAVSVVERRSEIGVHLALGARPVHLAAQVVIESAALALAGAVLGVMVGLALTIGYASVNALPVVIPMTGIGAGLVVAVMVGALAGLVPALRAARVDPAVVVRSH